MFGQAHAQKQVTGGPSPSPNLPAPCDTQTLSFGNSGGNLHLVGLGLWHLAGAAAHVAYMAGPLAGPGTLLTRHAVPHGHGTNTAARGLLQGHHDVAFNVTALFGGEVFLGKAAAPAKGRRAPATGGPENLLKEIAESSAAELKFVFLAARPAAPGLASAGEGFPAWRWTKIRPRIPISAQLIVLLALGRVAEDLVGLVDLLEFFFRLLFVLGNVGMELARELAEGFFDVGLARVARHSEAFIVIFVLNRHS